MQEKNFFLIIQPQLTLNFSVKFLQSMSHEQGSVEAGSSALSLGILLETKKNHKSFVGSSICKQNPVELYCSTFFAANNRTLEIL